MVVLFHGPQNVFHVVIISPILLAVVGALSFSLLYVALSSTTTDFGVMFGSNCCVSHSMYDIEWGKRSRTKEKEMGQVSRLASNWFEVQGLLHMQNTFY